LKTSNSFGNHSNVEPSYNDSAMQCKQLQVFNTMAANDAIEGAQISDRRTTGTRQREQVTNAPTKPGRPNAYLHPFVR
jgi:hypothetical protein